jgi:hypothetical protein
MKKLSETEKAYLAGLWDGDGHISIYKQKSYNYPDKVQYVLRITLTMTHKPTLEFCMNITGIGTIHKLQDTENTRRNLYQWRLAARKAEDVLREIYPYMKKRKSEADIALRFRDTIGRSSNKSKYKSEELWQHTLDIREELKQELHKIKLISY